jgi:hypothetical protein
MLSPQRDLTTSETQISVFWTAIPFGSINTGGANVDSYNLVWKIKNGIEDYTDLIG